MASRRKIDEEFDLNSCPKLKPCPKCDGDLEYYDSYVIACKNNQCDYTFYFELEVDED